MDEFEEMRNQLATMKSQLDTQQIINKELMKKVMKAKASWMNLLVKAELISLPFVYLLFVMICHVYGMSQWYSFSFLVCAAIDTVLDFRTIRIPPHLFSSSSILELRKFLVRQKRERFIQTTISGTICVIWIIVFVCAMTASNSTLFPDNDIREAALAGGLAGGAIGAIVGIIVIIFLYRKMQRTTDQILADIDTLEKEE